MIKIKETIKESVKNLISLKRNKMDIEKFKNIYCTGYNFNSTRVVTPNTGWTINYCYVYLIGNILMVSFDATRSSNLAAGNITNEWILTATIPHGGKIISTQGSSFLSRTSTGHLLSLFSGIYNLTASHCDVKVGVTATHAATNKARGIAIVPVGLNIDAY